MPDYEHSTEVAAPAEQLFDYLSDVGNLPKYFTSMESATPAEGDAVHTVAAVEGTRREGEAWFVVDKDARAIRWGAEGDSHYSGELTVTGDERGSEVAVRLHSHIDDAPRIDGGLRSTLDTIRSLVESGPAPHS